MREMLEGGPLDYLTGDYLAELTMLILGRDRRRDPALGYARTFLRQLRDCLTIIRDRNVRIVTNAGGLNPAGLAAAIRELAAEQGVDIPVAHVEGDELLDRGFPGALTANAYLGGFGIAAALREGAGIVVTGRVTDASLTLGPAIAEFGWTHDDLDELAAGVVAGHVLECGTQATGGNFAGFTTLDLSRPLGFPLAEISADGTIVITKHPGTGGAVTVDTVTAQLVYEIGAPAYLNPDVTARLDSLSLAEIGHSQIKISHVRGVAPPPSTKVALNRLAGHRNSVTFVLTGLDIPAKAAWIRDQLTRSLAGHAPSSLTWSLSRTDHPDPATQPEASALLHCHVRDPDPAMVGRAFTSAAVELALASIPGLYLTTPPADAVPYGVFEAAYVPQSTVPHTAVLPDGTRLDIPSPAHPPVSAGQEGEAPVSAGGEGCLGAGQGPGQRRRG
ncbi:acyclic terpene utilization AtuA family protein, partial [Actinoplanes sp. NPDC051851]|uniref:acyclic terpene utilization AtuA family protein n=1 Tax=Actinoplanes sp. NPDC051851 TaxID=3154753 RepID=UPI00341FA308